MNSRELLVFAALAAGCASVLDIEDPQPRPTDPDSGSSGQGGSSAGEPGASGNGGSADIGKGGTGGTSGGTGEAGKGGAGGDGGDSSDGGEAGAGPMCAVGTTRCGGAASKHPEVCNEDGDWVPDTTENDGQECPVFCVEGTCTECANADMKCNGNIRQECVDGFWEDQVLCESYCLAGGCQNPPSCSGLSDCAGANCCRALEVPGGMFKRDYDGNNFPDEMYPATVSSFLLDKFEVTVGRMRRFVNAYSSILLAEGDGKAPHIVEDEGWHESYPMPASSDELRAMLSCTNTTWGDEDQGLDALPANCVPFHVAYAFCIWDNGRLPTEAEWNYAAAGGDQQREYPWVVPLMEDPPTDLNAYFGQTSGRPIAVGSKAPGNGRWGHSDLGGNVLEWTLDFFADYPETCTNCLNATEAEFRTSRGGTYLDDPEGLLVAMRWETPADFVRSYLGFRCAHDLE